MTEMITELHSGLRWLLVLLALVMLVRLGQGTMARGSQKYGRPERLGMLIFQWLFRIQWLVGILLFLFRGNFVIGYRWEHAISMTLALALLELQRMRFPGVKDGQRYRHGLAALVVASILVFVGVLRLPVGWSI